MKNQAALEDYFTEHPLSRPKPAPDLALLEDRNSSPVITSKRDPMDGLSPWDECTSPELQLRSLIVAPRQEMASPKPQIIHRGRKIKTLLTGQNRPSSGKNYHQSSEKENFEMKIFENEPISPSSNNWSMKGPSLSMRNLIVEMTQHSPTMREAMTRKSEFKDLVSISPKYKNKVTFKDEMTSANEIQTSESPLKTGNEVVINDDVNDALSGPFRKKKKFIIKRFGYDVNKEFEELQSLKRNYFPDLRIPQFDEKVNKKKEPNERTQHSESQRSYISPEPTERELDVTGKKKNIHPKERINNFTLYKLGEPKVSARSKDKESIRESPSKEGQPNLKEKLKVLRRINKNASSRLSINRFKKPLPDNIKIIPIGSTQMLKNPDDALKVNKAKMELHPAYELDARLSKFSSKEGSLGSLGALTRVMASQDGTPVINVSQKSLKEFTMPDQVLEFKDLPLLKEPSYTGTSQIGESVDDLMGSIKTYFNQTLKVTPHILSKTGRPGYLENSYSPQKTVAPKVQKTNTIITKGRKLKKREEIEV